MPSYLQTVEAYGHGHGHGHGHGGHYGYGPGGWGLYGWPVRPPYYEPVYYTKPEIIVEEKKEIVVPPSPVQQDIKPMLFAGVGISILIVILMIAMIIKN